jgi:hypothetical protein
MRPDKDEDGEIIKLSEFERKNIKKQFLNVFQDFPEEEDTFGDSKAAQLAGTGAKPKKEKKEKIVDLEEQKLKDERKRQSDQ